MILLKILDFVIVTCLSPFILISGNTAEVAASVGAYGAMLHDGSEYTGNYINKITVEVMQIEK